MSPAKVTLSPKELELVNDPRWILTKNAIIEKVYGLFGGLSEAYRDALEKNIHMAKQGAGFRSPKITKGEQYESLPWVMLDHPRCFDGENILAIRSFFWWGNFCSISLLLSGSYRETYAASVENYFSSSIEQRRNWFICVKDDPWQHHFRKDNYLPLTEWGDNSFTSLPFIKLAKKTSLHNWNGLEGFFEKNYTAILEMLRTR